MKKLLSIESIEDSLKTAAKLEYQKLKKAINDYKTHTKEMQKRIVNKLFNADQEKIAKKDSGKKEETVDVSPPSQSQSNVDQSGANNVAEVAPVAETKEASSSQPVAVEAVPKAQTTSNNLIILLATSLVVVLLSIVFAVYSH